MFSPWPSIYHFLRVEALLSSTLRGCAGSQHGSDSLRQNYPLRNHAFAGRAASHDPPSRNMTVAMAMMQIGVVGMPVH